MAVALRVPVPASGAALCAFASVCIRFRPTLPVIANVTGKPYASVEEIRAGLARQVIAPVLWQQCIEHILYNPGNLEAALHESGGYNDVRHPDGDRSGGEGGEAGEAGAAASLMLTELYDMGP